MICTCALRSRSAAIPSAICRRSIARPQRDAKRKDFASLAQLVQGREHLVVADGLETRVVELVEIDAVGLQSAQTFLARPADEIRRPVVGPLALAGLHAGVIIEIVAEFRGDHDVVTASLECLGQHDLALAVTVDVCRVEEVHAEIAGLAQQPDTGVVILIRDAPHLGADRPHAKANFGDLEVCAF